MEFKSKTFLELTTMQLFEILRARSRVFVVEQTCPFQDPDDADYESLHIFREDENGKIAAYMRVFPKHDEEGCVQMGRVLTIKRGAGLGGLILKEGIREARDRMEARKIYLESQTYATGFYAREGFETVGEEFLEDGIPHIGMYLDLDGWKEGGAPSDGD